MASLISSSELFNNAPESKLPPFEVMFPAGTDPVKAAKDITTGQVDINKNNILVSSDELFSEERKNSLVKSAIISHNTDSDKWAENKKQAVKNGIPAAFATPADNPVSMDDMLSTINDFQRLNGQTAQHMSNPDFAKVAKDDHPVLTKLEDVFHGFTDRLYGSLETAESLITGIPAAIGGVATGMTTLALTKGDVDAAKAVQEGVTNFLTYKPKSETGQRYTEAIAPIISRPADIGREVTDIPLRQWNAPDWLRYIVNTAGEFGAYGLLDMAVKGGNAHITNIIDTAKESKLRGRDPEQFKSFVQDVAKDEPPVQMPAAKVDELLSSKNLKPEDVFTDPTAYYESKFMGDKVDIPIQDLAANAGHITPEHIKDMSIEGVPSVNEAEAQKASQPDIVQPAANVEGKQSPRETYSDKLENWIVEKAKSFTHEINYDQKLKRVSEAIRNGEAPDGMIEQDVRQLLPKTFDRETGETLDASNLDWPRTGTLLDFLEGREQQRYSEFEGNKAQEAPDHIAGAGKLIKGKGLSAEMKGADMFPSGPGAKTKGANGELPSDIEQLASTIPKGKAPSSFIKNTVEDTLQTIKGVKDTAVKSFTAMKDIGQKIWDAYRKPPEWTEFKDMLGEYQLNKAKSGLAATKFSKQIIESIPKDIQEQITMWIDSAGKTELSAEHRTLAENVKNYFSSRADQAIEAGVIDHAVENYVHRIWDRDSKIGQKISAETNAGMFQQNPKLAKQRVLSSISEGEALGLKMKDKRIGYLLTAYDTSLNEAIAARGFIKSLMKGKAKDGRSLVDISGSGKQIEKEGVPDSIIIKPKTKPAESVDYKSIDHPALRKWKWAGQDAEGKAILMQGDLVVHPEIYKHMRNILGRSAVREFQLWGHRPGEALLNGIQIMKGTLLSLSGFHQVQEGVHAIGHEVNPFKTKEIDLNDPLQADLVKHGVMVYSHNAMTDFAEGVYASGLVSKIPVIGRQMQAYGEYLFQGYIPRLKMEMARQAYERNTKRYKGKLDKDQIMELTAKEANAAFGELNYEMMGRNKTIQDMFRLVALAPDFLEARAKFVGQAFKPYGREQMIALLRLSAYMAIAAQTTNYLLNGEADWSQPFSVKINDEYYTLRSVPGDMIHLVTDPRSFSYHRLNPTISKPTGS